MHTGMPGLDPLATPKDGIRLSPPPPASCPKQQGLGGGLAPKENEGRIPGHRKHGY